MDAADYNRNFFNLEPIMVPEGDEYDNKSMWLAFVESPENWDKTDSGVLEAFHSGMVAAFGNAVAGRACKLIINYNHGNNTLALCAQSDQIKQSRSLRLPVAVKNHFNDAVQFATDALHSAEKRTPIGHTLEVASEAYRHAKIATAEAAMGEITQEVTAAESANQEALQQYKHVEAEYQLAIVGKNRECKGMTTEISAVLSQDSRYGWLRPVIKHFVHVVVDSQARKLYSAEHVAPTIR